MSKIEIQKIVEKMDLKNLTPDVGLADKYVEVPDINRPALQLTGFFDHFDAERVQIIGYVEYTFLEQMDAAMRRCSPTRFPASFSAGRCGRTRSCWRKPRSWTCLSSPQR